MKLTKKTDKRPCTDFIRTQLKIERQDKRIEFELGIQFIERNYQHIYTKMSRNKTFWNWFKLQWETRSKFVLDLLSIEPTETILTIQEINAILEAYKEVNDVFIKKPSRPSKNLLKIIQNA